MHHTVTCTVVVYLTASALVLCLHTTPSSLIIILLPYTTVIFRLFMPHILNDAFSPLIPFSCYCSLKSLSLLYTCPPPCVLHFLPPSHVSTFIHTLLPPSPSITFNFPSFFSLSPLPLSSSSLPLFSAPSLSILSLPSLYLPLSTSSFFLPLALNLLPPLLSPFHIRWIVCLVTVQSID